jgi:hypothetical protein
MSKKLWNTIEIKVPAELIQISKTGKLTTKKTLTKKNAISQNKNSGPAIKLIPDDSNSIEIINAGEMKTIAEKNTKQRTPRKKAATTAKPDKKYTIIETYHKNPQVKELEIKLNEIYNDFEKLRITIGKTRSAESIELHKNKLNLIRKDYNNVKSQVEMLAYKEYPSLLTDKNVFDLI